MSDSQATGTGTSSARVMSIIGIVCAVVALFLIPPLFAVIGAVLGFVANSKVDKPLGMYVGIAAIVAGVVGLILSALVLNATT